MPIRTPLNQQQNAVYPLAPSTIETIDQALFDYVDEKLNIFCDTNNGFKKVRVMFAGAERAFEIKKDPTARTQSGRTLQYPIISISRESVVANPANKGRYGVHIPPYFDYYDRGGAIEIARVIQQDKSKNFSNANAVRKSSSGVNKNMQTFPQDNKQLVYETISIPMPQFVEVRYTISTITNYQQQLNQIMTPFVTNTSSPSVFKVKNGGNEYEAFFDKNFALENNADNLGTEERIFGANFTITVLGYLIGADKNQETPNVVHRQSAAKLTIRGERAIVGDEPEFHKDVKSKYRP
jgi:hypothetical protein